MSFSVVVFNSNRWRYFQMQPKQFGIRRIFDAKFQLRWFQWEPSILTSFTICIQNLAELGSLWLHLELTPSTAKLECKQCNALLK